MLELQINYLISSAHTDGRNFRININKNDEIMFICSIALHIFYIQALCLAIIHNRRKGSLSFCGDLR